MVHIWHEDSTESSTSTMWKFLVKEKFNKKFNLKYLEPMEMENWFKR